MNTGDRIGGRAAVIGAAALEGLFGLMTLGTARGYVLGLGATGLRTNCG